MKKFFILTYKYGVTTKIYANGRTAEQVLSSEPTANRISEEREETEEYLDYLRLQKEVQRRSSVFG